MIKELLVSGGGHPNAKGSFDELLWLWEFRT